MQASPRLLSFHLGNGCRRESDLTVETAVQEGIASADLTEVGRCRGKRIENVDP